MVSASKRPLDGFLFLAMPLVYIFSPYAAIGWQGIKSALAARGAAYFDARSPMVRVKER